MKIKEEDKSIPQFFLAEKRILGCESNASRISRLCWKYGIPPTIFYNNYLNEGKPVNRSFFNFEIASRINSCTKQSVHLEVKLNNLIGQTRNSKKVFSYSFLSNVISQSGKGFIAPHKRWCSYCYNDRSEAINHEDVVFDDLYWSVDLIRVCMLHGTKLRDKCPHCGSRQPYISTSVEPGYCHFCEGYLGIGIDQQMDEEDWERHKALFTLFYVHTFEEFRPEFSRFRENLIALKKCFPSTTSQILGDLMGVSEDVVRKWISGARKPLVESLFQLQRALGLYGPHQLFYDTNTFLAKIAVSKTMSLHFNARDKEHFFSKEEIILRKFHRIFDGKDKTVSRKVLAKKFDVSIGYLQSRFYDQCRQLSCLHAERRQIEKEKSDNDLAVQLDRALSMVRSRKKKWTLENVMKEMPEEALASTNQKNLHIAFLKAKERFWKKRC